MMSGMLSIVIDYFGIKGVNMVLFDCVCGMVGIVEYFYLFGYWIFGLMVYLDMV